MFDDLKDMCSNRWQEILLIIGFMAIGIFLFEQISAEAAAIQRAATESGITNESGSMSPTTSFLYSLASMVFLVLWQILLLGFLATLNINYGTPLDPKLLIIIGRRFFWRMIRFQIILGLLYFAASMLIFNAMKWIFLQSVPNENISTWTLAICAVVSMAILSKPILLIPPIMICKNCMVLEAVAMMPNYKISDIKILPAVFITGLTLTVAISAALMNMQADAALFNIMVASKAITAGVLSLATGVIGVWFVGGNKFGVIGEELESEGEEVRG